MSCGWLESQPFPISQVSKRVIGLPAGISVPLGMGTIALIGSIQTYILVDSLWLQRNGHYGGRLLGAKLRSLCTTADNNRWKTNLRL